MKSSVAVFSDQGDPFPTQARTRTHYHPSTPHMLTEAQKQTVLSPDRLRSLPHHLSDALFPPDLRFLMGSQRLVPGLPESDSSEPFDESWPSTEGSSKTPERDEQPTASTNGNNDEQGDPGPEDSVLARYIARFRSGRPTSRRERSPPHSGLKDFWWLQESPESPEVQRFRPPSGTPAPLESSPHNLERTPTLEESSLNDSRLCPEDVDVAGLQLRAGKLILRSESSLSSVGPVSSEGLGSSPVSNVSSSESDRSSKTRPLPLDTAPVVPLLRLNLPYIRAHPTAAPEDDILYQWRLRRKMEQAREGTLHTTTRKRSSSPPVRIPKAVVHMEDSTDPVYQVSPRGAVQSHSVSSQSHIPVSYLSHVPLASPSGTPTCSVPPHLHLLCDILPCVHSQNAPSVSQVKQEKAAVGPAARHSEDGPLPVGHVAQKGKDSPERQTKAEQMEAKKLKPKGDRSRRKRDKKEPSQQARAMVGAVPESSVHQAMEQVISERLFSPLPSPKAKSEKMGQRPSTPSPEGDADLQPVEIAAHLLEEAEDSDGTDFTDDPLLQVLRDQREFLRSRLRAVDSRLAELEKREP
ncbi:proline and serine-rich protein 3 isoform X1 [Bufo bufo]|uniref:proline and serine-rich protein 3 isoform X1 n=2 Tax=Bufo bufo TaxID=8384 RepID=UPI001ABE83F2|nr:proline and serine-rich protein 3 isoform X1 [Bufo bufo]